MLAVLETGEVKEFITTNGQGPIPQKYFSAESPQEGKVRRSWSTGGRAWDSISRDSGKTNVAG